MNASWKPNDYEVGPNFGKQIFGPIDNSQVFRATTFDGWLGQATSPTHNEVQRLYDHAFTTASSGGTGPSRSKPRIPVNGDVNH
jgi:hypothetical protein